MGLKYCVEKHVGKGMIVQILQNGILKLNHLLFNELFKLKNTYMGWGWWKITCHLKVLLERKCFVVVLRFQKGRDVDQP
jgi:hypothetical protein